MSDRVSLRLGYPEDWWLSCIMIQFMHFEASVCRPEGVVILVETLIAQGGGEGEENPFSSQDMVLHQKKEV